ncbi:uncharacterized protein LOC122577443 [Bombus pyrosoma]|uniref:uncharacterized protein LOC122577443 n=1 Tax=Bombus pyrosoma TaxID=396416 RepID=UPI001CB96EAD|nr:uncharacterized protein LOC122577443 [Bombus pyrosoma]
MMSTKKRSRKSDADKPSRTKQLVTWIKKVRCKKFMCCQNRRRDLRIEAMLTCTLLKAENQLRIQQSSKALKLQQLKRQCLKKAKYSNYELCSDEDRENQRNLWKESSCPELSSLDDFMSKVAEVKVPLQR